jgi:uncharacterized protein YbjQ (UPF0145 family)
MLVTTTGSVSGAESTNKDILGFMASNVSVAKSGDKYVASASIAAKGDEVKTYESLAKDTAAEAVAEFAGLAKGGFIEFNIDSNGKITDVSAPATSMHPAMSSTSKTN